MCQDNYNMYKHPFIFHLNSYLYCYLFQFKRETQATVSNLQFQNGKVNNISLKEQATFNSFQQVIKHKIKLATTMYSQSFVYWPTS